MEDRTADSTVGSRCSSYNFVRRSSKLSESEPLKKKKCFVEVYHDDPKSSLTNGSYHVVEMPKLKS